MRHPLRKFIERKEPVIAQQFLDGLRSAGVSENRLLYGRALMEGLQGRKSLARSSFQHCIEALPQWAACYEELVLVATPQNELAILTMLKKRALADPKNVAVQESIAKVNLGLRHMARALSASREALRLAGDDPAIQLRCSLLLAETLTANFSDWAQAKSVLNRALELAVQLGDDEMELICLDSLMRASFLAGDHDAAKASFEQLTARALDMGNTLKVALACQRWGTLNREQGDSEIAVRADKRALSIIEALRPVFLPEMLLELSRAEEKHGDSRNSSEHLARAMDVAERLKAPVFPQVLRTMAEVKAQAGDYSTAVELHTKAIQIFRDTGNPWAAAGTLSDLGVAYARLGDDINAERCYQESWRSARQLGDVSLQELLLTLRAELDVRKRDYPAATEKLRKSLTLSSRTGATRFRADTLINLGLAYLDSNNDAAALRCLHDGLDIARVLHNRPLQSIGLQALAEALLKAGNATDAAECFREARSTGDAVGLAEALQLAEEGLGDVARRQNRLDDAVAHYRASIEAIEAARARLISAEYRTVFLTHRTDAYERIIDVLMRQGKSREALYYAESSRARVFRETLAEARVSSGEVKPATAVDAATIEREMALRKSVLIEYALGSDRSYVWAVTARKIVGATLPPRADIERAVQAYRQALIARDTRAEAAAGRLYRILVAPVASELALGTTLIIAADGVLHYLPFEALVAENGRFLAENFTFAYTPSASALDIWGRPSSRSWSKALLALGDPDFGKNGREIEGATDLTRRVDINRGLRLTPLPNTRIEVQNIASLYPSGSSKLLLGRDASKASLAKEIFSDFKDIHIATHAFYDEARPERSGIVLSATDHDDGVLRFGDIVKLRLNTDLVVLSACQTGLGRLVRGEGIDGIARAFLLAGSPRVVVSLWNVNDVATADLMRAFYGKMTAGLPPAEALREAKVDMIHSKIVGYRDPYLWAAFVLIGRP